VFSKRDSEEHIEMYRRLVIIGDYSNLMSLTESAKIKIRALVQFLC